jgi:DNA-binding HxlR family transcriptional regulator
VDTDAPKETMSDQLPVQRLDCPSRDVIAMLANKWVLYVLGLLTLTDKPLRFSELQRAIEGVTQKSLTQTLRALERDGLVDRKVYATVPPRVEYRLTDLGREAGRLTGAIADWAVENAPRVTAARVGFDSSPAEGAAPTATPWTTRLT